MSEVLFIGEAEETWPWRLIGVDVRVPSGNEVSWLEAAAGYAVVLVAEGVQRSRPEAVEALAKRLPPESALTVVPGSAGSDHLSHLRARTLKAMGVDTWSRTGDSSEAAR